MFLDVKHFLNHTCQLIVPCNLATACRVCSATKLVPLLEFLLQNLPRQATSQAFDNLLGSCCLLRSQDVADLVGCLTICLHCLSLCCHSILCTISDRNILEVLSSKKKILFQKMLPYGSNLCLERARKN